MTHPQLCALLAQLPHYSDQHGFSPEDMAWLTGIRIVVAECRRLLTVEEEGRLLALLRTYQEGEGQS